MSSQIRYTQPSHTSTSGTNADEYYPSSGGKISTKGALAVTIYTNRSADTGTATFQVFGEFLYEPLNAWYPWLDYAGTQIQGVQMANDATNASTPFYQMVHVQLQPLMVDADGIVIMNTVHKLYQAQIPAFIRWRFRHGGTTVTNTFSSYTVLGGVM